MAEHDTYLDLIFQEQRRLMEGYHGIISNGPVAFISELPPVDIDSPRGQLIIKHSIYCALEEISETMAYPWTPGTKAPKLAREELIDVLHFFIEICILTAANSLDIFIPLPEKYIDGERVDPLVVWMGTLPGVELLDSWHKPLNEMVFYLLSSGHTLKNKPWKQTLKPTDMNLFYKYLRSAFYSYLRTAHRMGMTAGDIYNAYMKKNKANHKRQETGY